MKRVRGRIVDTWHSERPGFGVVVAEDSLRHLVVLSSPIPHGHLIEALVDDNNLARDVRTLSEMHLSSADGDARRWRSEVGRPTRFDRIRERHVILTAIRAWFDRASFLEVQTPLLVPSTAPELHIESLEAGDNYLVTSTEYQIKRLIVGGFERVYTLGQNFRKGEVGPLHNPEFTMLEWARAYESLQEIQRDAETFVKAAFAALRPGQTHIEREGKSIEIAGAAWDQLTVRDALATHMNVDVPKDWSLRDLAKQTSHLAIPDGFLEDPWSLMSWLIEAMQPHLGWHRPVFLTEWPAFMTPTAGLGSNPAIAERAELFVAGVEVSDGFSFACDPVAQRERFVEAQRQRAAHGKQAVRLDEQYLSALEEGLPPGAGMALGIDRLVMLLTGATSLRDVLTFAWEER